MYKYEKLIDDLIALMNTETPDQERAEELVPAYHNASETANERLYECEAMIRKGHEQAADCFDEIKRIRDIHELRAKLTMDRDNPDNQRTNVPIAAE